MGHYLDGRVSLVAGTHTQDVYKRQIEACPHATMELSIPSKNAFPPGSLLRKCKENE